MRGILVGMTLLAASADVLADVNCFTISDAALRGANAEIETLMTQGGQINCQFPDGWNALMHAVYAKKSDTIKLLLAKGADPNMKRNDGVTALAMAKAHVILAMGDNARVAASAMVKTLTDAGAK